MATEVNNVSGRSPASRLSPQAKAMLDEMAATERRTRTAQLNIIVEEHYKLWKEAKRG